MLWYILIIYLAIGVIITGPLIYVGALVEQPEITREDLCDLKLLIGRGLGSLLAVIIWPFWIGLIIYYAYS